MIEMTLRELQRERETTTREIRLVSSEIASNKLKFFRERKVIRTSNDSSSDKTKQTMHLNKEERTLSQKNDLTLRQLKDKKQKLERMIREARA